MSKATEANIEKATEIEKALVNFGTEKKGNKGHSPILKSEAGELSFTPALIVLLGVCGVQTPEPPPHTKLVTKDGEKDIPPSKKAWEDVAKAARKSCNNKVQWARKTLNVAMIDFVYVRNGAIVHGSTGRRFE